jgi:hypothetical protein
MRLEVLMGNKISEKFVLTNEGSLNYTDYGWYVQPKGRSVRKIVL